MKIAIVSLDNSKRIKTGGKHIHQELLKRGLKSLGHEVEEFYPEKNLSFFFYRILFLILRKVKLISGTFIFDWTLKRHSLNIQKQLIKSVLNFDVFFCQDPVSAVAVDKSNISSKEKNILTLHGYLSLESVNYGNYLDNEKKDVINHALVYERESLKCVQSVIAVDTRISDYIQRELNYDGDIKVLKNAIDVDLFNCLSQLDKQNLKEDYSIATDRKIVLVPRRLVKKNGVEVAIRAINDLVRQDKKSFTLLVMGDGPLMNSLKKLCDKLGLSSCDIQFLGSINHDQAVKFYDLADIVLVPSIISDGIEEATSLSMLEGMAAKKMVVVSAIGGMKEVINNKINGFSFEQGNIEQLSFILNDLLYIDANHSESIKEKAYSDVCSKHHYKEHAKAYLSQICIKKEA